GGRTFRGLLDEMAIFDRALTAQEIMGIYNSASFAAASDTATVATTANLDVLANDNVGAAQVPMIDNVTATVGSPVTLPSGAIVTPLASGELQYNPNGFIGNDSFTYTVSNFDSPP